MRYMIMRKVSNSMGSGWYIETDGNGCQYLGYSLREAEARHRRRFNCVGKHFIKVRY